MSFEVGAKDAAPPRGTVYEKLEALCEEIKSDIRASSGPDGGGVSLGQALAKLSERAFLDRSPEAQYAILLYRKYKEVQPQGVASSSSPSDGATAAAALPHWLRSHTEKIPRLTALADNALEGTGEQLVGFDSTKKNIFRLRALVCCLALLGFSILSSAPLFHLAAPTAHDFFLPSCALFNTNITGHFDFTSYQAVVASGVCLFIHSLIFSVYYLLPVDETGQKHVPGLERLFAPCKVEANTVHSASSRVSIFCAIHSKKFEAIIDAMLLVLNFSTTLAASINIERGSKFDFPTVVGWYTLGTFTLTFQETSPPCMSPDQSPASKIRAGLAFMYLCMFIQVLTLMVSMRSYAKESIQRAASSLGGNGSGGYDARRSLVANADPDDESVVEVSL